jgi:hypothetical protein
MNTHIDCAESGTMPILAVIDKAAKHLSDHAITLTFIFLWCFLHHLPLNLLLYAVSSTER